jgi:hypothetical protein
MEITCRRAPNHIPAKQKNKHAVKITKQKIGLQTSTLALADYSLAVFVKIVISNLKVIVLKPCSFTILKQVSVNTPGTNLGLAEFVEESPLTRPLRILETHQQGLKQLRKKQLILY